MERFGNRKNAGEVPENPSLYGEPQLCSGSAAGTARSAGPNAAGGSSTAGAARPEVSPGIVNLLVALYLVCVVNVPFWRAFAQKLGLVSAGHWTFFLLTGLGMVAAFNMVLSLFSWKPVYKPLILLLLAVSSLCGYFMQNYGVIIDKQMIVNVLETDKREASELMTWALFSHLFVAGGLPALLLMYVRIGYKPWRRELLARSGVVLASGLLVVVLIVVGFKQLALFGRENRDLRMYLIPSYPIYSMIKAVKTHGTPEREQPLRVIAADAVRPAHAGRAIVLVVGETARAENFSLNGYGRDTNPLLKSRDVFSFTDVQSCGTETAESLPCMFSSLGRADYSRSAAARQENVLDILQRTGVRVLWRDNNSGSKGVADRVGMVNLSDAADGALCSTGECYDDILLKDLDRVLKENKGDILVVLHQKGSHGPSYYKRFPRPYARFLPQCTQDNVQDCEPGSIVNAYDNTILYTDHFLSRLIDMLKEQRYATAMLYVSDHGESLGEHNIYLHGLPYSIAPEEQKHVPMIFWGSDRFFRESGTDRQALKAELHAPLSHDYLFHSLLGLFQVKTAVYRPTLDMFRRAGSSSAVGG